MNKPQEDYIAILTCITTALVVGVLLFVFVIHLNVESLHERLDDMVVVEVEYHEDE